MKTLPIVNRNIRIQNALILFGSALVMFLGISHEPLWLDESYSAQMSSHSLSDIWLFSQTDVHPPLYYLLLHIFTLFWGTTEFSYRILSAGFAMGLVALGIGPIARLWNRQVGILFSLIVMFAPCVIGFAQETRMYTMLMFTVTGAVIYGLLAFSKRQTKDYLWFGTLLIAGMYTHYYAVLTLAIFGLLLLLATMLSPNHPKKQILFTLIFAIVSYLPWIPSFWTQIQRVHEGFWIPKANGFILEYAAMIPFSFKFEDIPYPWWALASMAISLFLIGYSFIRLFPHKKMRLVLFAPMTVFVSTFIAGILISWFIAPVLMPRYLLAVSGLFFLAVAVGLSSISQNTVRHGVLAVFLLLMLPTDIIIYQQTFNGPFKTLRAQILKHGNTRTPIVHEDWQTLLPMRYQLPDNPHFMLVAKKDSQTAFDDFYGKNIPTVIHSLEEAFELAPSIWVIDSNLGTLIESDTLRQIPTITQTGPPPMTTKLPYSFVKPTLIGLKKK